jgi:hypothetical protein
MISRTWTEGLEVVDIKIGKFPRWFSQQKTIGAWEIPSPAGLISTGSWRTPGK